MIHICKVFQQYKFQSALLYQIYVQCENQIACMYMAFHLYVFFYVRSQQNDLHYDNHAIHICKVFHQYELKCALLDIIYLHLNNEILATIWLFLYVFAHGWPR